MNTIYWLMLKWEPEVSRRRKKTNINKSRWRGAKVRTAGGIDVSVKGSKAGSKGRFRLDSSDL